MSKLELLQCKTCGGHIDRDTLTCQSCGAMYRLSEDCIPVKLEVSQLKFKTICSQTITPAYYVNQYGEDIMKHTLEDMAHQMAEKLLPLIEFQTEYEPRTMEYITYGRLRVADPHVSSEKSVYDAMRF